ncbi:MAG TPA: hypothetical protein VF177_11615 [Anaerolineae bacterium]
MRHKSRHFSKGDDGQHSLAGVDVDGIIATEFLDYRVWFAGDGCRADVIVPTVTTNQVARELRPGLASVESKKSLLLTISNFSRDGSYTRTNFSPEAHMV